MKRTTRPTDLWRAFAAVAERHPDRQIVQAVEHAAAWTAAELQERAARLCAEAELEGVRGGCIAFCLPTSPEWMETFLATQCAGLAALPIDPTATPRHWKDTAAALGATHALAGKRLVPLRPPAAARDITWSRFACAKVTSGSTGAPTVIPCRTAHLLADGENVTRSMRIRPRDRNLAILPLGHSYGLGNLVMPLIGQGTGMVTAATYLPRQILEWIGEYGITVFPTVPVVLRILSGIEGDYDLRSLRLVISAGAPLPAETAAGFFARFGRRVHNFYGSSETGGICYDSTGAASLSGRSVGKPMHGVRVEVARGGRIRVSGKAVATSRGSCTLADIGRWGTRGELEITGRAAPVANIGGRKVSPAEVETALLSIPAVTAAWVKVLRHASRDELAAAVESARPEAEIVYELAGRLAKWKLPRRLVVARDLPRNPRGKLDATALKGLVGAAGSPE